MIHNKNQYNQGIGKYKVLSSTAGVGSIVPTTWGGFVMPLSIDNWPMIDSFINQRRNHPGDSLDRVAEDSKCTLVNDQRFVEYLRCIHQLPNLEALIAVPHLNLNEYNYCDYKSHPLFKKWAKANRQLQNERDEDYIRRFIAQNDTLTIPSIVFPRWFRSSFGGRELMPIESWYEKWRQDTHQTNDYLFVPPVESRKDGAGRIIVRKDKNNNEFPKGFPLEQIQMVLICPNGHISDIPWDKYFAFKLDAQRHGVRLTGDSYSDLFSSNANTCNDGQPHKLQWIPNRNNPESYGTLKCSCCKESVSLEGIMNIRPRCQGEKPWVGNPQSNRHAKEDCGEFMRWALVTSNSVYYADSFNSLFIPNSLLGIQLDNELNDVLDKLVEKQENWRNSNQSNNDFFECYLFPTIVSDEVEEILESDCSNEMITNILNVFKNNAQENTLDKDSRVIYRNLRRNYSVDNGPNSIKIICVKEIDNTISNDDAKLVLQTFEQGPQDEMNPEKYRYDEFKVFMENTTYGHNPEDKYLRFNDIDLNQMNAIVSQYFSKIKQISNLAVSTTQLQFTRASNENSDDENQGIDTVNQMIFNRNRDEVLALPANQNFGEGLFFSLNEDSIRDFCNQEDVRERYSNLGCKGLGYNVLSQMNQYGAAKFYLLHTFSHIIMKELEFTCGYPTASLQERLYYSDRMCGVLIYTADGSEGSMGGLVAQGSPVTIEKIIKKAIERAVDCSSDPLCWEHTNDQLNLAACFSCCMVSETSCEYFNMGLDRKALVDSNFGFFKDLVYEQV